MTSSHTALTSEVFAEWKRKKKEKKDAVGASGSVLLTESYCALVIWESGVMGNGGGGSKGQVEKRAAHAKDRMG